MLLFTLTILITPSLRDLCKPTWVPDVLQADSNLKYKPTFEAAVVFTRSFEQLMSVIRRV